MDRRGRIALVSAIVLVAAVLALSVYAAPKKCNNGIDDDGDGLIDLADPGCSGLNDNTETSAALVCDDGVDSAADADSLADYRLVGGDPGCTSPTDTSEIDGQCDDLIDNDGDSLTDYPADPHCSSYSDNRELVDDSCSDSDGFDITVQGTVSGFTSGNPFSFTDSCLTGTVLLEHTCSGTSPSSLNYTCGGNFTGCSNGACV
jgi:hypothetical protein